MLRGQSAANDDARRFAREPGGRQAVGTASVGVKGNKTAFDLATHVKETEALDVRGKGRAGTAAQKINDDTGWSARMGTVE